MSATLGSTTAVTPTPLLYLDGAPVATALGTGARPDPVAVDSLSYEWGRTSVFAHPDSPTATVTLFSTSRDWLVTQGNVVGRRLSLGYTLTDAGGAVTAAGFTGRVLAESLRPHTHHDPVTGAAVPGVLLTLTAASELTTLANRVLGQQTPWANESFGARAARLAGLCSDVVATVNLRDYFLTARTAYRADVIGADVLTLIRDLYSSCDGDRMMYLPSLTGLPSISYVPRRTYSLPAYGGLIDVGGTLADGRYHGSVLPAPNLAAADPDSGAPFRNAVVLDGQALEWVDTPVLDGAAQLTRLVLNYYDAATGAKATLVRGLPGQNEALTGSRALTVDTVCEAVAAGVTADALVAVATGEGAQWSPGRYKWTTDSFDDRDQAAALLSGVETAAQVLVIGGPFHELGLSPILSLLGGSVRYAAGRWTVELTPTQAHWDVPLPPRLQLGNLAGPGYTARTLADFHPSVRLADVGAVSIGLGGALQPEAP